MSAANNKTVNVYIPFIEIYLQLEAEASDTLIKLADMIKQVTSNDNELSIFRFKFKGELLSMKTQLQEIRNIFDGNPQTYLTAYAQMNGA